jgi:hypothetical protein
MFSNSNKLKSRRQNKNLEGKLPQPEGGKNMFLN